MRGPTTTASPAPGWRRWLLLLLLAVIYPSCLMAAPPAEPGDDYTLHDMGPAVAGFPVNAASQIGDRLYIFSLGLDPARFIEFDLDHRNVTGTVEIPTGLRTWASTTFDGKLYFGMWGASARRSQNFFRFDPASGELASLPHVDGGNEFWTLDAAPDARIYAGTQRSGRIFEYDPENNELDERTFDDPRDSQVTALHATERSVYLGTGRRKAGLLKLDRATDELRDLTPAEMEGGIGVRDLVVTEHHIIVSTHQSPGRIFALKRESPGDYRYVKTDEDDLLGPLLPASSEAGEPVLYFAGIQTGTLYRWDMESDRPEPLASPVPHAPTRALFSHEGRIVGLSAAGILWRYDLETERIDQHDLVDAGAKGGPEPPQSLAVSTHGVYVGTNNAVQVHPHDGGEPYRFIVPGEPKAMHAVDGTVYMAMYPGALLWKHDGAGEQAQRVAAWTNMENRPRHLTHDPERDLILIGTHSDFRSTGSLVVYDRARQQHHVIENPLDGQSVNTVATHGDTFIGAITRWGRQARLEHTPDGANAPLTEGTLSQSFSIDESFNWVAARLRTGDNDAAPAAQLTLRRDEPEGKMIATRELERVFDDRLAALVTDEPMPAGRYVLEVKPMRGQLGWPIDPAAPLEGGEAKLDGSPVEGGRALLVDEHEPASVAALDPGTGDERWRIAPVPEANTITGLQADAEHVFGLTNDGTFFAIERESARVAHRQPLLPGNPGELRWHRGKLLAISSDRLVEVDPTSFQTRTIARELHPRAFTHAVLDFDEEGGIYLLSGSNLIRVGVSGER